MALTLIKLNKDLQKFDIRKEVIGTIKDTAEDIAELNRGQLFVGKRADDKMIEPPYAPFTIRIKEMLGQPVDRVTLKFTGAFWASIKVNVKSDTYTVTATDNKRKKLEAKYGEEILGLSDESKREEYLPNYFMPALKKRIFNKIGVNF